MSERVWKRVSSLRPERILLLLKKTMKKLVLTHWKVKKMREEKNIKI